MLRGCIMLPLALLRERHSSRPDGLTAPFGVVRVEQTTTAAAAPPAASCGRTRLRPAEALSSSGSGFATPASASAPEAVGKQEPIIDLAGDLHGIPADDYTTTMVAELTAR